MIHVTEHHLWTYEMQSEAIQWETSRTMVGREPGKSIWTVQRSHGWQVSCRCCEWDHTLTWEHVHTYTQTVIFFPLFKSLFALLLLGRLYWSSKLAFIVLTEAGFDIEWESRVVWLCFLFLLFDICVWNLHFHFFPKRPCVGVLRVRNVNF